MAKVASGRLEPTRPARDVGARYAAVAPALSERAGSSSTSRSMSRPASPDAECRSGRRVGRRRAAPHSHGLSAAAAPSRVRCAARRASQPRGASQHDCLVLRDRHQAFGVGDWSVGGAEKVKVTGRLSSNTANIVRGWAIDGHGILLSTRWTWPRTSRTARSYACCRRSRPADVWAATTSRLASRRRCASASRSCRNS